VLLNLGKVSVILALGRHREPECGNFVTSAAIYCRGHIEQLQEEYEVEPRQQFAEGHLHPTIGAGLWRKKRPCCKLLPAGVGKPLQNG